MAARLDDLPQLSRLLDEALALGPGQADAWLDALPPAQRHLQAPLRDMLARHRVQAHAGFLAAGPRLSAVAPDDSVAQPGDEVGPYRLIREIGRGGMGAVWLAERADGTLKRQVALKLPRLTWGARLAERMARERDIGALLEHPNIARLYDAGVDARGRPYLALEHVDGEPIDAWCRHRTLAVPQRLRLFLQVARAVAYAHGRLVVHRDIKPSNVLVTPDGRAQLLDFGIARLLHEAAPAGERPTLELDRLLTPLYASPEQFGGEPVTVASDVYSLGVLLFELLTGRLPHEPARRGLASIEAAVLEGEAPRASSRAQDAVTAHALRGELDAILAKALKRRPEDRYATADAFAEDIERHLAGERVLAQPDSLAYRLAKTWARHRVGLTAAAAVLLAVLGGTAVAVVQARRATEAAEQARIVKAFVIDLFKANPHGRPSHDALRQLPVELLAERGAALIDAGFKDRPQLQAELYGVVGGIFAGIGNDEQAARLATRQLETQVAMRASAADQAQATLLLAQALASQGRAAEAHAMARSALALAGNDALLRPRIRLLLAHVLLQLSQREAGLAELDVALLEMQGRPALAGDNARARALRASLLIAEGRFDEARTLYRGAIDDALAAEGVLSPTAIDIRVVLANNLARQGRSDDARELRTAALAALRASGGAGEVRAALEEAEIAKADFLARRIGFEPAREAIERSRAFVQSRRPLVPARIEATIEFDLGTAALAWGDLQRADTLLAASSATLAREANTPRDRQQRADVQGTAAMLAGRHDEAEALFRLSMDLQRTMGAAHDPDRVFDLARRALNLGMQRRFDDAQALLADEPGPGAGPVHRAVRRHVLARLREDRGDSAAALALLPAGDGDEPGPYPFDPLLLRGEILCDLGRHDDGLALLERSLAAHASGDYAHSPHLARARALAGLCALQAGRRGRAVELAEAARASLRDQPSAGDWFRAPSVRLDDRLRTPTPRSGSG